MIRKFLILSICMIMGLYGGSKKVLKELVKTFVSEAYHSDYKIINESYKIPAGDYFYKIIQKNKDWGNSGIALYGYISCYQDPSSFGKQDVNLFIFNEEQLEEYRGNTMPDSCLFAQHRFSFLPLNAIHLSWEKNKKYYFVISNKFSRITEKTVELFLIVVPYREKCK